MQRLAWPRKVESVHKAPGGPGTLSALKRLAMARGLTPPANFEDAAHDPGLGLVDPPLPLDRLAHAVGAPHHIVAVAEAAAGLVLSMVSGLCR